MRNTLMAALAASALLAACESRDAKLERDREHLAHVQTQAAEDIAKARADAAREKERADNDAANRIAKDRKDVSEARGQLNKDALGAADRPRSTSIADTRTDHHEVEVTTPVLSRADSLPARPDRARERAEGPATPRTLTGTLGSTSGKTLTLRDRNGQEFKLKEDDRTQVLQRGRAVKIGDFREGTEIRASYVLDGSDRVARDVEVLADHPLRR